MIIKLKRIPRAFTIVALLITLIIVGAIAYYASRSIVHRGRTISENQDRKYTNDLVNVPELSYWITAPPTNGETVFDLDDETTANLFATVANYRIEWSSNLVDWSATGNEIPADGPGIKSLMALMATTEARVQSNSVSGFYRASKLTQP